ncbi:MAG: hypothetical protein AUJ75_03790 [Candidatus Omnitrophica bacterium CG1_02_49_10]|nr:MAG: hypothetical protein AUJ75_03790 [Candidatus Omnitrophica bacterium CG1_02_49_10]
MSYTVHVKLRDAGEVITYDLNNLSLKVGDCVIIQADRGVEYGEVVSECCCSSSEKKDVHPLKKVLRKATKEDTSRIQANRSRKKYAIDTCRKKVEERKLPMDIIGAEYSFDRSKIIFYFTSEGRVDFRDLVKGLAQAFKARIELKQIGVRDEARFLGGFGPCGRRLCCAQFLSDFAPVTIRMAKEQNMSLNPTKISGICGRLMCCLGYEYKTYKELLKGLPKEGAKIKTDTGAGRVIDVNPLTRTVTVELEDKRQVKLDYTDPKPKVKYDGQ